MIYFLTGRPGGGKSLTMAEKIYKALKSGKNVIANFEINEDYFKKCRHPEKLGKFLYVPNEWWLNNGFTNIDPRLNRYSYIDGLYGFAKNFHKTNEKGQIKEGQTLPGHGIAKTVLRGVSSSVFTDTTAIPVTLSHRTIKTLISRSGEYYRKKSNAVAYPI